MLSAMDFRHLREHLTGGLWMACLVASPLSAAADPAALIESLTAAETFETGVSPTHSGSNFPPVDGQSTWGVATLGHNTPHQPNKALRDLVAMGPAALPLLLKHLDDDRPSRIEVTHEGGFGGMWHAAEVPALHPEEQERLKAILPSEDHFGGLDQGIHRHQVTVGDLCFVAIGMITNRAYNTVRYQPTNCIVVNSPTAVPEIAAAVRGLWPGNPSAAMLERHLRRDFESGNPRYQAGAALRWLYYFPEAALPRLVAALKDSPEDSPLIRALSWHRDPELSALIRSIAMTARDSNVVEAALPAFRSKADADRESDLMVLIDRWKLDRDDPYRGALEGVLIRLLSDHPARAAEVIRHALEHADDPARLALLDAAGAAKPDPSAVRELAPLLDIRRAGRGSYLIEGPGVLESPGAGDYLELRVCDLAWVVISRALGDADAVCTGRRGDMDERIAGLRRHLRQHPENPAYPDEWILRRKAERAERAEQVKRMLAEADAADGAMAWVLKLENDQLPAERWFEALGGLFTGVDSDSREFRNAVANFRYRKWTRPVDQLDDEGSRRVTDALIRRIRGRLETAESFPDESTAGLLALASGRPGDAAAEVRLSALQKLERAARRGGLQGDSIEATILMLDALLVDDTPGAAALLATLCRKWGPEDLESGFDLKEFLTLVTRHQEKREVAAALTDLFAKGGAWDPRRRSYAELDAFTEAGLLDIAAYRRALAAALEATDIVGEISVREDDHDYCWMEWENSSSGKGIKEGEPRGFKPGETMKIRRCDMIAEASANPIFAEHDGPAYHIYWPLAERDAAIGAWKAWLKSPPGP